MSLQTFSSVEVVPWDQGSHVHGIQKSEEMPANEGFSRWHMQLDYRQRFAGAKVVCCAAVGTRFACALHGIPDEKMKGSAGGAFIQHGAG